MKRFMLIAVVAAGVLAPEARAAGNSPKAPSNQKATGELTTDEAPKLAEIRIVYQLDPRLTKSLYMGDRWVMPPIYVRVGDVRKKDVAIEARIFGVDSDGKLVDIDGEWATTDPKMVDVEPSKFAKVKGKKSPKEVHGRYTITVRRAGETGLRVSAEEVSKELLVKAVQKGGVLQVEITQKKPKQEQQS